MRKYVLKLEKENKELRTKYNTEKEARDTIEAKLKKNAIMNELKENSMAINENTFFESKKSKLS